ncbi:MAG: 23S rRNA (guanosine(2251)-2'-O)-methyltransferase RlmB [Deltaproteobacteria bacterium]|nr:23S rRNA (guanosine(2251)-2'-O)-methyltransferase RlmB [Deltaproteobacteria bacterium]
MLAEPAGTVNDERRSGAAAPYVAAGHHAVEAFLAARPDDVDRVLVTRGAAAVGGAGGRVRVEQVAREDIDRVAQGIPHQGVVALGRPPRAWRIEDLLAAKPNVVLVLDEVTDPRNVGAILRSAESAGAGAVVLSHDRAPQLTPALVKAAAGAVEWVPLVRVVNIARSLEAMQGAGYWTVGLAGEADVSLYDPGAVPGMPVALVLGSEGGGMRPLVRRWCHRLVRIPMQGRTASLNVSVAAALALFEIRRRAADRMVGPGLPGTEP